MNLDAAPLVLLAAGVCALLGHSLPRTRSAPSTTALACMAAVGVAWIAFTGSPRLPSGFLEWCVTAALLLACLVAPEIVRMKSTSAEPAHHPGLHGIVMTTLMRHQAQVTLDAFRQERESMGLGSRITDSFVVTEHEHVRDEAERTLASCETRLATAVPEWTTQEACRTLALDAQATARHARALDKHRPHRLLVEAARRLEGLALRAEDDLVEAISDLKSASTTETFDAVSSNKGIAIMSSMHNQEASDSVKKAQASIEALQAETDRVSAQLTGVDDTLDLIMDLAWDGVFDFMSFLNIGKLDSARRKCEEALARVTTERVRLGDVVQAAIADAKPTLDAVNAITRPHLEKAVDQLPGVVRALAPADLPLPTTTP